MSNHEFCIYNCGATDCPAPYYMEFDSDKFANAIAEIIDQPFFGDIGPKTKAYLNEHYK